MQDEFCILTICQPPFEVPNACSVLQSSCEYAAVNDTIEQHPCSCSRAAQIDIYNHLSGRREKPKASIPLLDATLESHGRRHVLSIAALQTGGRNPPRSSPQVAMTCLVNALVSLFGDKISLHSGHNAAM